MIYRNEEGVLDPQKVPRHVAIIMDGNRRWARNCGVSTREGHRKGAEVLMEVVDVAIGFGIKVITVFAFSTENWHRPKSEVAVLLDLLKSFLEEKQEAMIERGVKLELIGDINPFPEAIKNVLQETKMKTAACCKICLVLALNYGGRDDLRRACIKIAEDYKEGKLQKKEITEDLISSCLDTASFGDPELLIRTSGEMRVSNFLLWQISYTEVYLTETLWPEFSRQNFFDALISYQKRERRLGI